MAHRLLRSNLLKINRLTPVKQTFEYLLIIDFEATCQKDEALKPQEIIEFPCLALSTITWEVQDVFHEYIKPQVHPVLTTYCTKLTGIIQEMTDQSQHFPDTFLNFQRWLHKSGYSENGKSKFVTCGDWDLRVMLPEQCAMSQIPVPSYFNDWINLKNSFLHATGYYPRSLKDMLKHLNLPLRGHLHSGIDDTYNMARIIQLLGTKYQTDFRVTSVAR